MKFFQLLAYYRDRANLSKTEVATRLGVSPSYVMNLETGRRKPPTISRCEELGKILNLSEKEVNAFIDIAMEERDPKGSEFLQKRERKYSEAKKICTDEILEALTDPVAVKALLATHGSKEDLKRVIQDVIENLSRIPKDKRNEILRLCQESI